AADESRDAGEPLLRIGTPLRRSFLLRARCSVLLIVEGAVFPAHRRTDLLHGRRIEGPSPDPDTERADELGLHRIREQGDLMAAARAPERRGEGPVARLLALGELHLLVAGDAEKLHRASCVVRRGWRLMSLLRAAGPGCSTASRLG